MRSAALPWCPALAGTGPPIPIVQRRLVARFLAVFFIGFFLAFAFAFIFSAALAMVFSLFSLSSSNQLELQNPEQFLPVC